MKVMIRIIAFFVTAFLCWTFLPHEDLWDLVGFLIWLVVGTYCLSGLVLIVLEEDD